MLKYKIIPVVAMCMIAVSSSVVYADSLKDNLNSYSQQLNTVNQQAEQQAQLESAALQQAQSLRQSADLLQTAVNNNNQTILVHRTTISDIRSKEKVLIETRDRAIRSMGDYLKAEYEKSSSPVMNNIQFLLGAESLGDFMIRVAYIEEILEAHNKLKDQIETDTKDLEENKKEEQTTVDNLEESLQSQLLMQSSLNAAIEKQEQIIASLNEESMKIYESMDSIQSDVDHIQSLIDTEEMEAGYYQQDKAKGLPSAMSRSGRYTAPVKFNGNASQIIKYAESFLGTPYVLGGNSPNPGFDCSSLVQYSYAKFGINLPRVTWDQFYQGSSVGKGNLKAGDLVFFSTYAPGPSHVGIYIGNGMMIHDANRGVVYENMNNSYFVNKFVGAKRVFS